MNSDEVEHTYPSEEFEPIAHSSITTREELQQICEYEGFYEYIDYSDTIDTTAAMEISSDDMFGSSIAFSADSENGMFDTAIIILAVSLASLYALTHIAEKILKIKKEYLD